MSYAHVWLLCLVLWIHMKPLPMTERRTHVHIHKRVLCINTCAQASFHRTCQTHVLRACVAAVLCCILWTHMKPMSMTERRTHVRMHKRALCINTCAQPSFHRTCQRMSAAHDEIASHNERKKRTFANMSSVTILPPSPPQSMLGTIANQDLDEKERFFRIGSTAKMRQH